MIERYKYLKTILEKHNISLSCEEKSRLDWASNVSSAISILENILENRGINMKGEYGYGYENKRS